MGRLDRLARSRKRRLEEPVWLNSGPLSVSLEESEPNKERSKRSASKQLRAPGLQREPMSSTYRESVNLAYLVLYLRDNDLSLKD